MSFITIKILSALAIILVAEAYLLIIIVRKRNVQAKTVSNRN